MPTWTSSGPTLRSNQSKYQRLAAPALRTRAFGPVLQRQRSQLVGHVVEELTRYPVTGRLLVGDRFARWRRRRWPHEAADPAPEASIDESGSNERRAQLGRRFGARRTVGRLGCHRARYQTTSRPGRGIHDVWRGIVPRVWSRR
jgi:hypothetical protein